MRVCSPQPCLCHESCGGVFPHLQICSDLALGCAKWNFNVGRKPSVPSGHDPWKPAPAGCANQLATCPSSPPSQFPCEGSKAEQLWLPLSTKGEREILRSRDSNVRLWARWPGLVLGAEAGPAKLCAEQGGNQAAPSGGP